MKWLRSACRVATAGRLAYRRATKPGVPAAEVFESAAG